LVAVPLLLAVVTPGTFTDRPASNGLPEC
jgi:hypothetical protein